MITLKQALHKNPIGVLVEIGSNHGLIHTPLSKVPNPLQTTFCPKEGTLTIRELSQRASKAKFLCTKGVHLPVLGLVNPFLRRKVKKNEYVPVNPDAPPKERSYIQSSLQAAITATAELPPCENTPLGKRIDTISSHIQTLPTSLSTVLEGKDNTVLIHRSDDNKLSVDPVTFKNFTNKPLHEKERYLEKNPSFRFLHSIFHPHNNAVTQLGKVLGFPYFFYKEESASPQG